MRRHLVTLGRAAESGALHGLCRTLKDWEQRLDTLEADGLLERMERWSRRAPPLRTSSGRTQSRCGTPPRWPLR